MAVEVASAEAVEEGADEAASDGEYSGSYKYDVVEEFTDGQNTNLLIRSHADLI